MSYQDPNQQNQYGGYSSPQSPYEQPSSSYEQPSYGQQAPYGDPYSQQPPYGQQQAPYGQQPPTYGDPYSQQPPYGQQQSPYDQQSPYGQQQAYGQQLPYGQQPYGTGKSDDTSMGMQENNAVMLAYAFGWITGLIVFFSESKNRRVRVQAMQSILLFARAHVLVSILLFMPYISTLGVLLWIASAVIWIVLLVNAGQGRYLRLPVVSDYAEQFTK